MGLTAEPDAITVGLPPPASGPLHPPPGGASLGAGPAGPGGIDSLSSDADEDGPGSSNGSSGGSGGGEEAAPGRHVLVVACDGLWDYVPNEEAVHVALRCATGVWFAAQDG